MKNFTPDQKLLLKAALSILGSAASGAFSAGYQQWSTGVVNPGVVLNVVLLAFITLLGKSLYDYVPSHITEELQAGRDLQAQLFAHPPIASTPSTPAQPLVVIHTQNATTASSTPAPAQPTPQATPVVPIARTNPTGGSTVAVPMDDLLADVPDSPAMNVSSRITGVIPTYGASGK